MSRRQLDELCAAAAVEAAIAALPPPPLMRGRGIVIPGGGARYFPGAWVCVRTLRDVGCALPIEMCHVGESELDREMRALVEPLGVVCVDAEQVRRRHPARFLQGWPLKAYAMLHSGFREVLLLDADNMPLADPTYLFEEPAYQRTGAVFWPDKGCLAAHRKIWALTGVAYREEPAVESGQLLVDKAACWRPLALAAWMNCEHADFFYRYVYGDKDTFHLAWRRLGLDYAMPPHPMGSLPHTMIQHDFAGRPLFQHRHGNKWTLDNQLLRIPGFLWEDRCRGYLAELRECWSGRPAKPYRPDDADAPTRAIAESLTGSAWAMSTAEGERVVRFGNDGRVSGGGAREQHWSAQVHPLDAVLSISGIDSLAWLLARGNPDCWVGQAPAEPGRRVELLRLQ